MSRYRILPLLFLLLLSNRCNNKDSCFTLNVPKDIIIIGHKGSGPIQTNGNIDLLENSWPAIQNAMIQLDGSEIDIQMSADSTLWVFHNHKILNCEDTLINFSLCSDIDLYKYSRCNYNSELLELDTLLKKINESGWKEKTLCFDLKTLYNPVANKIFSDSITQSIYVRDEIKKRNTNNSINFIVEVYPEESYKVFYSVFKENTYKVNSSPSRDFIRKKNKKNIKLSLPIYNLPNNLKYSSLIGQDLWTINTAEQFLQVISLKPHIMQSDNVPLMVYFKNIRDEGKSLCGEKKTFNLSPGKDQFYNLASIDLTELKDNYLFRLTTEENNYINDVLLTLTIRDQQDSTVYWKGINLYNNPNPYFFINPRYLLSKGGNILQITIWNKARTTLRKHVSLIKYTPK